MKLMSNTKFGEFLRSKKIEFSQPLEYLMWYEKTRDNYDNFLQQPLTLGMFVPCDENGNILEIPLYYKSFIDLDEDMDEDLPIEVLQKCKIYFDAKERVLFKGFEINNNRLENYKICAFLFDGNKWNLNHHIGYEIEDLIYDDIELTDSAIKQLGL